MIHLTKNSLKYWTLLKIHLLTKILVTVLFLMPLMFFFQLAYVTSIITHGSCEPISQGKYTDWYKICISHGVVCSECL